jgi:mRNA interferase MazF
MQSFEPGQTVRVPFPYIDRPVRQYRPALVVSRRPLGSDSELLWVLMITSARNRRWQGDVAVPKGPESGLPVASLVRTAKIATIEVASASRIGRLTAAQLAEVMENIRSALA